MVGCDRCGQKHPLVHDNEQCKPIVIETIKFLYDLDMEEGKDVDLTNPIARPRIPHEIMFVIGGWSGGSPTNVIETYDTRADRWITVEYADRGQSLIFPRLLPYFLVNFYAFYWPAYT